MISYQAIHLAFGQAYLTVKIIFIFYIFFEEIIVFKKSTLDSITIEHLLFHRIRQIRFHRSDYKVKCNTEIFTSN